MSVRQVTALEPEVHAFLERHADRLNAQIPRGIWASEHDGKPDVLLLVYTEPYLRLSFIAEEGHRPASLLRLGEAFDEWALGNQITRYTMVVDESDNRYRLMLERLGAIELSRSGGWVEYAREPSREQEREDGIRLWTPQDWTSLRPLMRAFLKEDVQAGGELAPVRENVEEHIRQGVRAAHAGDPCLLAQAEGATVGFVMLHGQPSNLYTPAAKLCLAVGLYVKPSERRKGWGRRLYQAALDRARLAGYHRVAALARTKQAFSVHQALGFKPGGALVGLSL